MSAKKDNRSEPVTAPHPKDRGKTTKESTRKRRKDCKKIDEFEQMNGAESAYFRKA